MGKLQKVIEEEEGPLASINIIPFVDIVLVLLVIFMLTSSTIMRASIEVDLPKAASGGEKVTSTLNLMLDKQGALHLDGEPVDFETAAKRIRAERRTDPKLQAVIAADEGVAYGRIMALIDLVKQNGVSAFALDVERGTATLGAAAPAAGVR